MILVLILFSLSSTFSRAGTWTVTDSFKRPIENVMVTETPFEVTPTDVSDGGYPKSGVSHFSEPEITRFTDGHGHVRFDERKTPLSYRFRKPGWADGRIQSVPGTPSQSITLKVEADPMKLSLQKPANAWLGALEIGTPEEKNHFKMQCGFCHQQGSVFTRRERTVEDWQAVMKRMVRYGSRLSTDLQESLPSRLQLAYRKLRDDPSQLAQETPWPKNLSGVQLTEWPMGDGMSQIHDVLVGKNGKVYAADNIQDRLYELDPKTSHITLFKIPHLKGDSPGGLIAARLKDFPKHDSTSNAHSLALSAVDGHIFITPSAQRRLIEFNPDDQTFKLHEIGGGFYPHTIRIDQTDNVWFTLALSNQIGRFSRQNEHFTLYDLPTRGLRERMIVRSMGAIFKLISWGIPLTNGLPIDRFATGTPLPYGIDITPDGKVWFARLHTQEIGCIDPETGKITLIKTPFMGPRRLRVDGEGNVWVVSFGESLLSRYDPKTGKFSKFELPVIPVGSETPYSLFVDRKRKEVWVNGNQSDSTFIFDIQKETWRRIPFSKMTTFTRDFDQGDDGAMYTSISNFPSWQIEGGRPTLIQIRTGETKR